MTQPHAVIAENPQKEARTANWVAFVICTALLFDGYDLVIYGTVLPGLLADPGQIGTFDVATAGLLGSWALVGVLVGSLICGAVGDFFGRRRLMLLGIAWFSVGMFVTALTTTVMTFGAMRFITGLGLGIVIASAGATMAEFAPAGRRQFYNAIVYSGVPAGGVVASVMGILFQDSLGWRGLFIIGALPLVILFPIAWRKLPESPRWLLSRGREEEAMEAAERTGVPLLEERVILDSGAAPQKSGFAAVFSRQFAVASVLLGLMSFCGLLLTYGLNTWLPKIMEGYGYGRTYSLFFPLALNLGAVAGGLIASRLADRSGPQRVIASTFALATVSLVLMTFNFPLPMLFTFIAVAGVGTLGTQVLIYGFQSNYFTTNARAAGVAWCASVGRLGGVLGPIIGGWLAAAGIGGSTAFYIYGGVALLGALVTVMVPPQRKLEEAEHQVEEIAGHRTEPSAAVKQPQ
ncbi:AAHS family benzoate transporter-like MFS transporter [Pseudarthrobacter oxydans]|uniref:AAHS family benzoate transporter-like MFS transporter n=1 Tax=Pseudarthrobacter oxydans TaxID=1671 RepID=A0AAW8N6Z3_PSEOX|nr:aromatic acid/H+ symport family MFS transporter [Pseudarthrobacter oxydans]MDR6792029.1 AAHS family benzoate transporter-like MFS transporter [Pseudarthrobacter oxydans]MDR7163447.1 AAHS family benzoate transporter-like MFS transporter [Pseudarthrobacter oxydans]